MNWDEIIKVDYVWHRSFHYHIVLISKNNDKIKISKYVGMPLPSYENLDQLLLNIYNLTLENTKFNTKLKD